MARNTSRYVRDTKLKCDKRKFNAPPKDVKDEKHLTALKGEPLRPPTKTKGRTPWKFTATQ